MYGGLIRRAPATAEDSFGAPRTHYTHGASALERLRLYVAPSGMIAIDGRPPDLAFPPAAAAFANRCPRAKDDCARPRQWRRSAPDGLAPVTTQFTRPLGPPCRGKEDRLMALSAGHSPGRAHRRPDGQSRPHPSGSRADRTGFWGLLFIASEVTAVEAREPEKSIAPGETAGARRGKRGRARRRFGRSTPCAVCGAFGVASGSRARTFTEIRPVRRLRICAGHMHGF